MAVERLMEIDPPTSPRTTEEALADEQAKLRETRETDLQRKCREICDREIYCNVSQLISDLHTCLVRRRSSALSHATHEPYLEDEQCANLSYVETPSEDEPGETEEHEVLEHWAVSDYLATRLEEQGERVVEVAGLNVWCRTTSGMACYMDGWIRSYVAENCL